MNAVKVLEDLKRRFPNEPEYHQAVEEVLATIEEEYNKHPDSCRIAGGKRLIHRSHFHRFIFRYGLCRVSRILTSG